MQGRSLEGYKGGAGGGGGDGNHTAKFCSKMKWRQIECNSSEDRGGGWVGAVCILLIWMSFGSFSLRELTVCTVCVWHCEHARFFLWKFFMRHIKFFIHSRCEVGRKEIKHGTAVMFYSELCYSILQDSKLRLPDSCYFFQFSQKPWFLLGWRSLHETAYEFHLQNSFIWTSLNQHCLTVPHSWCQTLVISHVLSWTDSCKFLLAGPPAVIDL